MAATLWKGHLSFGLVSIPIKLVRAARAEKIHMHNLHRATGSRVKQVFVPEAPEPEPQVTEPEPAPKRSTVVPFARENARQPEAAFTNFPTPAPPAPTGVPKQDLVRAFEYEKDKYVAFEPEELQSIAPRNSTTMEILEFVKFEEVDPVYLETSYYVVPDKGGEKPYALLFEALRKTGNSALAEVVMYRRDQTILIRAASHGLIAHTLYHNDEVRRSEEFHVDSALVKPAEVDLAIKLVGALAAEFDPTKFKDKYRERLQEAISQKVSTGAVTQSTAAERTAPVVDIMAALKASLSQTKKPAARETGPTPAKKKRAGNH